MGFTMQESAPNQQQDLRKRRSTRIVQAVPLAVTGVDALGRPFQERTSTLMINCHGCRYQSKHYVLKNMWVSLEVPHPDAGRGTRAVRGRVTWIQRPRTVRELFQVGVELEIPGNFWGIAFPPPDWFPFPESAGSSIPAEIITSGIAPAPEQEASESGPASSNLVVMNSPSTEASLQMARQVARLLSEAKQQIQSAARDAVSKTVPQEARRVLDSVQTQLEKSAGRAIEQAIESHAKHWLERADALIEEKSRTITEELREQWNREAETRVSEARTLLAASVTSAEQSEREQFEASLGASVESALVRLRQSAEDAAARAKAATEELAQARKKFDETIAHAEQRLELALSSKVSQGTVELDEFRAVANQAELEIRRVATETESTLRAHAESGFAEVRSHLQSQISTAVDEATRAATERIGEISKQQIGEVEARVSSNAASMRQQADEIHAHSADLLGHLSAELRKESLHAEKLLAEIHAAGERTNEFGKQLEIAQEVAKQRLDLHLNTLVESATESLNSRANDAVLAMAAKLQPALDAAGAATVARLATDVEDRISSRIEHARHTIADLTMAHEGAAERLRSQQEQLSDSAERMLRDSVERLDANSERLQKQWQEWANSSMEKMSADLELRTTETSHTAFEALYKAANWYEKKAQTQMQSALERNIASATESLRAKAGEVSSLFASEIDHYSRGFVDHAHSQLEERASASVESAAEKIRHAADAMQHAATEKAREQSREELDSFSGKLRQAFDQSASQLEAHTAQIQAKMGVDARHFVTQFQKALHDQAGAAISSAKHNLDAQASATIESAGRVREAHERQFEESMSQAEDAALEAHKTRLDSASNAWLVSSAATLNERAQQQIESLARTTEERLRSVFTRVFSNIGESLRERLVDVGSLIPNSALPPNK